MTKHKPQPMFVGSIVFKPDRCLSPEAIDRLNLMSGGVLSVKCRCQETGINPDAVRDLVLGLMEIDIMAKVKTNSKTNAHTIRDIRKIARAVLAKAKEIEL